ncbi:hypothetical protein CHUAL_011616 [Chamberlinius hualienensis]
MGSTGKLNTMSSTLGIYSNRQMQDHLDFSGRIVDKYLVQDSTFPQLVDQLGCGSQGAAVVSGLHDRDYPNLAEVGPGLSHLLEAVSVKRVPLPAELLEQFTHMQSNCMMGLFPEIGRAWLTVDSNIFVWSFEDGGDLAYFDGLGETIFGVGLVKPKPGVFQPFINFLLCLTTGVEIVMLGVSFSYPQETGGSEDFKTREMHLVPEPLYTLPTDNTYMSCIAGLDNGRIFTGGKDGCLYEITYKGEEGWFGRKCKKINHSSGSLSFLVPSFVSSAFTEDDAIIQISVDNSRNILYTRSDKGTITVYDLGMDGMGMTRVTYLTQSNILQSACNVAQTIEPSNFHPIVSLSSIEIQESAHIHLVAVTHAGVRLYFTTVNLMSAQNRPSTLQLVHVRLPTGFSAVSPPIRPQNVHMSYYKRGTFLMASTQTDTSDLLWCLSNDSFGFCGQLMENQTTLQIDGKMWAVAELPSEMHVVVPAQLQPPTIVIQHSQQPRKFAILSAQGTHIIAKLRPVDQLRQLILDSRGVDSDVVRSFFTLHQEEQACAMCLILACSPVPQDKQVSEWAVRALFLYGGEPVLRLPNTYLASNQVSSLQQNFPSTPISPINASFHPTQASTPVTGSVQMQQFPQMSFVGAGTPQSPPIRLPFFEQQAGSQIPDISFSGVHNGLYLYFSRIVRPLWKERLTVEVPCDSSRTGFNYYLESNFTSAELGFYMEQLRCLSSFLKCNSNILLPHASENLSATHNLTQRLNTLLSSGEPNLFQQQLQIQKRLSAEAVLQEKSSIYNLLMLVDLSIEMLGLWRILYDHQFSIFIVTLQQDYQDQLRSMTFKDLFLTGQPLASVLIAHLLNRYFGDNASTGAISGRLREVCPTIYKAEDATFSRANELLIESQKTKSRFERENLIQEAIALCQKVIPKVNMPIICQQLQAVQCYSGIVDLCLLAAQRQDPQNLAINYYKNNCPSSDQHGYHAFCDKIESYKHITDAMNQLLIIRSGQPFSSSVPKSPGPPVNSVEPPSLGSDEAETIFEEVLRLGLQCDDELFHVTIYNWLLSQKMENRLLEIKSPYLEDFLTRTVANSSNAATPSSSNIVMMDLLCKYYEKNANYLAAAKVLTKLADKHGTDINLRKRLEYLARAIVCMRSAEVTTSYRIEGEYLHELEEKIEVAQIQMKIHDALNQINTREAQEAVSRLNADLLDITQLYEEYAFPFNLHECQLAVIHCANLYDSALIETLWQNIIDKELNQSGGVEMKISALGNTLKSLGKTYSSTSKYFPIAFLIKYLETKSINSNLDPKWVYSTLLSAGISLPKLFDAYNRFYKTKDAQWLPMRNALHLLKVLSYIVSTFAENSTSVSTFERAQFSTFCLNCIACYLVDLLTMDGNDPTVRTIMESFRTTQRRLERSV